MKTPKAKLTRLFLCVLVGFGAAAWCGRMLFQRQPTVQTPVIASQEAPNPLLPPEEPPANSTVTVVGESTPLAALAQSAQDGRTTSKQVSLLHRVDELLRDAPAEERRTAARLAEFALNRKTAALRSLPRQDVESLVKYVAKRMPATEFSDAVQRYLGVSTAPDMPAEDQVANLMSVYDNLAGTTPVPDLGAPIVITDNCTSDARVIGRTHDLPAGVRRVYAVFENAGTLRGLDNVFVVWRKPSDQTMVYSTSEPLRSDAGYNYVWLQVDKGWPAGSYQVELYNPRDNAVALAKRSFTIQ